MVVPLMNKKSLLVFAIVAISLVGLMMTAYIFIMSLSPSSKAENEALVVVDIPELKSGIVNKIDIKGHTLFVLKPNDEQIASISALNLHVWSVNSQTYHEKFGVYVYLCIFSD